MIGGSFCLSFDKTLILFYHARLLERRQSIEIYVFSDWAICRDFNFGTRIIWQALLHRCVQALCGSVIIKIWYLDLPTKLGILCRQESIILYRRVEEAYTTFKFINICQGLTRGWYCSRVGRNAIFVMIITGVHLLIVTVPLWLLKWPAKGLLQFGAQ